MFRGLQLTKLKTHKLILGTVCVIEAGKIKYEKFAQVEYVKHQEFDNFYNGISISNAHVNF